ncbi:glycosyltransferase [Azospirillum sp. ST 5-10]|uniref:glycosyltransferase n=1 Tax=unclassified Azospirillum TaxID=2630922 RepID=UPI003F4A7B31
MLESLKPLVRRVLARAPGGASAERVLRRLYRRLAGPAPLPAVPSATAATAALPAIGIVAPADAPGLAERLAALAPAMLVPLAHAGEAAARGCRYVYAPRSGATALGERELRNVVLAVLHRDLDFLLISRTLDEAPALALAGALADQAVVAADAAPVFLEGRAPARPLTGRLMRLLPAPAGTTATSLGAALGHAAPQWDGAWIGLGGAPAVPAPRATAGGALPLAAAANGRTVLVLPIFLAVGGVERNTVEIVRSLRGRWDFVMATSERLATRQGSLHHQAVPLAPVYDLAEVAENADHLALMAAVARTHRPDVVWICNGSPWLVHHAAALRELFRDAGIVDQQVYDTDVGWIAHYPDPGIQSFDRFIAITRRIRTVFVERLGMDPARIDLIYSAIDAPRFDRPPADAAEKARLSALTGIPADRRCFAFIGRLTDQKAPLNFLELARRAAAAGSDDRFVLIGDGELAGACEAFVAGHGLANVQRIPFCNDLTQVYPLLAGLVVSSRYEGLPIAMLEAMAMGVPVFATDVGDIRAVLEDYGSGFTVPPDDAEALAQGFARWQAALPEFAAKARDAAPEVRARFATATIAGQYEEGWRRAMAAR